jgi:hypothetical protein
VEYADYERALAERHPGLAAELAGSRGLGGVMGWMKQRGIALADVEIINQDEYDLDFVIPLGSGEHLVFGIT